MEDKDKDKEFYTQLYTSWKDAFRSIGMWHISLDRCAQILAIIYDNGSNEAFILAPRFVTDWKTAQERLLLYGGEEIPADRLEEVAEGRRLMKKYIKELEDTYTPGVSLKESLPQWAKDIYHDYELPIVG